MLKTMTQMRNLKVTDGSSSMLTQTNNQMTSSNWSLTYPVYSM